MKKTLLAVCGVAFLMTACNMETNVRETKREDKTTVQPAAPVDDTAPAEDSVPVEDTEESEQK